jgi:hypothetical protein
LREFAVIFLEGIYRGGVSELEPAHSVILEEFSFLQKLLLYEMR